MTPRYRTSCLAALMAVAIVSADRPALAETLTGSKAFGGWADDAPGVRRHFELGDMPAPTPGKASSNRAGVEPRSEGMAPKVPAGFKIELVASGIAGPRVIRTAPNGDIFVAELRGQRGAALAPGRGRCQALRAQRVCQRSVQALRHRLLSAGSGSRMGLRRQCRQRRPLSLSQWRHDGRRRAAAHRGATFPRCTTGRATSPSPPDGKTMYLSVGSGLQRGARHGQGACPAASRRGPRRQPLGATWDPEEGRADRARLHAGGQGRAHRRDRACATAPA